MTSLSFQCRPRYVALIFFNLAVILYFVIYEGFSDGIDAIEEIENPSEIIANPNTNHEAELLHEIESLKLENLRLEKQKNEMNEKNKALELQQSNLISHHQQNTNANNSSAQSMADYYLLYGYCSLKNGMYRYHYIIMDSFKAFIASQYPHWIVINISIEHFLIHHSNDNYTHQKLLDFTQANVPSINLKTDKFQWMIEPTCQDYLTKTKHLNLKEYYYKNHLSLIERPQLAKDYLLKQFGLNIVDDNEREVHSHIVTMNHHKYESIDQSRKYEINIPDDQLNNVTLANMWQNNIYIHSNIKYLQSLSNNRPLLLAMTGEAFDAWRVKKVEGLHGYDVDVHIQRTHSWPRPGCIVTAYMQGILQRDLTFEQDWGPHTMDVWNMMDYNKLVLEKRDMDFVLAQKNRFCAFTVKNIMIYGKYFADALIRHTFNLMISQQYKHCDMLGLYHDEQTPIEVLCNKKNPKYKNWPAWHHLLVECQKHFKFSINMENTLTFGYTSEKIYTGLLASTIPIYFGNKDIAQIVNLDRIVYCQIPDQIVVNLREQWWEQQKIIKEELGLDVKTDPDANRTVQFMMDPLIKKWALSEYGPYLQDCVNEVIEIDKNYTRYKWKLSQDIVPRNSFEKSHYDGSIIVKSIIDIMKYLESPLFE